MKVVPTSSAYLQSNEASFRQSVLEENRRNVKRDEEWNPQRLVLTDTVTGTRYLVTVTSGALSLTAL